ncbi:MAG: hypothetical protein JSR43_13710 [Proteobacteria bacterium]|nr:hypothetical protein [Pseudomonadota bacterium]
MVLRRVAVIPDIVVRHAEEAAFLWLRRGREIDGQLLGADDIGRIDRRLDANLDGLEAAGSAGWETAVQRFALFPEAGEAFVLGTLALRAGDDERLAIAVQSAKTLGAAGLKALSGAAARTARQRLRGCVARWLNSADPFERTLGLCALSHHRVNAAAYESRLIEDGDVTVRRRACRLAGELGSRDLAARLVHHMQANDVGEVFEAACALCLLGEDAQAVPVLDRLVGHEAFGARAVELRLLATPGVTGRRWLQGLLEQPTLRAAATAAIGVVGDPVIMPWLIRAMRDAALVRPAGVALRDLFAVDFNDTDLFSIDPTLFPDDMGRPLEEGELPVADRVAQWWDRTRGEGMTAFQSMRTLRLGSLRSAMIQPGQPLHNWRATRCFPAWM